MGNIISLKAVRELKQAKDADLAYQAYILGLDKLQLLEEMVQFQERRSAQGHLTTEMMLKGRVLFSALERQAETQELRNLARSYRRHLDFELQALKTAGAGENS